MCQPTRQHQPERVIAVLGQFSTADALRQAVVSLRDSGYTDLEVYSPFPIHGLDGLLGIRPTRLPWLVLAAGILGCVAALWLQWWTNAVDYPFLISGKPLFSLPANIPVAFELTILFSAFAAFFGAIFLSGLPRFATPELKSPVFSGASSHTFCVAILAAKREIDVPKCQRLLQSLGAEKAEPLYETASRLASSTTLTLLTTAALLLAAVFPLLIAIDRLTPSDRLRVHPVPDMDRQPKLKTQAASWLFPDRRAMRRRVKGTVPREMVVADDHFTRGTVDGVFADTFPEQLGEITLSLMRRGRDRYNIYCAPCHGLAGYGDGPVARRALDRRDSVGWVKPLSLHSPVVRQQPVGKVFDTISNGVRTMPPYKTLIPIKDRWAIVLYVKALQRSQCGKFDDLPPEVQARFTTTVGSESNKRR